MNPPTRTIPRPVSPGEVLYEEFLRPQGLDVNAFAKKADLAPVLVEYLLRGWQQVTPEVAVHLAKATGATEAFWLKVQEVHDRRLVELGARRPSDADALSALRTVAAWLAPGPTSAEPRDELVAVNAAGLAPFGLELRAVQKLIAAGKLKATTIGRRTMTKRSYLLALVDELGVAARPARQARTTLEGATDLRAAVRAVAERRARKRAKRAGGRS